MRAIHFSKYDIALFIKDKGKTRWTHLLKEFVENGSEKHISRQRLTDYLKELVDEGLVTKSVDPTAVMLRRLWRVYPVYTIPKSRKKDWKKLETRKRC